MTCRSLIPGRLARDVVAWAGRVSARDPHLARVREDAEWAEDQRLLEQAAAAGRAIAATWPADAYPGIDTHAWQEPDWVALGDGMDPEQIEGDRRYLDDWPLPDCLDLDAAAAEAARIIPTNPDPDRVRDVAAARVLLAVLLHAAAHDYRDLDAVQAWAADLTDTGLDTVHTTVHGCPCGDMWPALALLALAQSLPNTARTRISGLITTALRDADATTTGTRP